MKKIFNILGKNFKKIFFRKVKNIGVKKGFGFMPIDDYYIDEDTYVFGFKVKTDRYWNMEDYKSRKNPKKIVINKNKKEVN